MMDFDRMLFDLFGISRTELNELLNTRPRIINIKSADYPNGASVRVDGRIIYMIPEK